MGCRLLRKAGAPELAGRLVRVVCSFWAVWSLYGSSLSTKHLENRGSDPLVRPSMLCHSRLIGGLSALLLQFLVHMGFFVVVLSLRSVVLRLAQYDRSRVCFPLLGAARSAIGIPNGLARTSTRRSSGGILMMHRHVSSRTKSTWVQAAEIVLILHAVDGPWYRHASQLGASRCRPSADSASFRSRRLAEHITTRLRSERR